MVCFELRKHDQFYSIGIGTDAALSAARGHASHAPFQTS